VAAKVLAAVEGGHEYVLTHPDIIPLARARAEHLVDQITADPEARRLTSR
jgi:hypothetical protein